VLLGCPESIWTRRNLWSNNVSIVMDEVMIRRLVGAYWIGLVGAYTDWHISTSLNLNITTYVRSKFDYGSIILFSFLLVLVVLHRIPAHNFPIQLYL
jgi:hypothetical protein